MGSEGLPSRWEGIEDRIPESLDELHGPSHGTLALPLHLCWSGMRVFDLGNYPNGTRTGTNDAPGGHQDALPWRRRV